MEDIKSSFRSNGRCDPYNPWPCCIAWLLLATVFFVVAAFIEGWTDALAFGLLGALCAFFGVEWWITKDSDVDDL